MAKKKKNKAGEAPSGEGVKLIGKNRKAFHNYEILAKVECGIVLRGTEVKSLRDNSADFSDSYATIRDDELFLVGLNIAEYSMAHEGNHAPDRTRKLLARKRQIGKLRSAINEKGVTLVPLRLYWKRGLCKVEIGLARGKQQHDKRVALRKREVKREKERAIRKYGRQ